VPHPHIARRAGQGSVKVADQHPSGSAFARFNTRLGLLITTVVGTMICAYIFLAIALISLPSAIHSDNPTILVAWLSSNCIQLVLLPIIIVGQRVQSAAADKRSEQTYLDAESILHECLELQKHLQAQDETLTAVLLRDGHRR
jgi:hypothetical protein